MNQALRTRQDSGIASIGSIPADWELTAARRFLRLKKHLVGKRSDDFKLLSLTKQGVIPRDITENKGKFPESFDTYQSVQNGDLVLCLFDIDETPRTVGLSAFDGMITGAYSVFHCATDWYRDYLYLLLLHLDDAKGLKPFYSGLRKTIRPPEFLSIRFPVPSQNEARAIFEYVSTETTRIDALIEKKIRFIELLKEKRQALITQAVTKGLDPNVQMRDSGMPSVGDVPSHWDVVALRRSLKLKKNLVGKMWESFKLLSLTRRGVIYRDTSENHGKFPESFEAYQSVEPGDLVCCLFDIDETPRTVGLSNLGGMITGAYSVFTCQDRLAMQYLYYLLLHIDDIKGLKPFYSGLRKTVRPPEFLSIRFPLPPNGEVEKIVRYIESETSKMDRLVSLTEESVALLKERRSALITAAVTGQIDLREAA
ncbi:MAG: hypothetical protein CMN84_10860 [Spongiibacteraceae bacterium]|mgnify:CR=1 FL=1|nr:hypothetical protein [Spongiibacteraceae bacterium]